MKNYVTALLITLLLAGTQICFSQQYKPLPDTATKMAFTRSWPVNGAQWTYCLTGWNGLPAGEEVMQVTGDTLLDGSHYYILGFKDFSQRTLYTRFSNDTVYRYVNNREYVFFTFNLKLGDVFSTFRTAGWNYHWEDSSCISTLPLKVIGVDEVNFSGQTFKKFVLEDTLFNYLYDNPNQEPVKYTLIERIGVINTYPFINIQEPVNNCYLPSDFSSGRVGKYSDEDFVHQFSECEGVGIIQNEILEENIRIFPNPASNSVDITILDNATGPYQFKLINNLGCEVYNGRLDSIPLKIDLTKHSSGTYFLVFIPEQKTQSVISFKILISK
jgi:hypothetical protein